MILAENERKREEKMYLAYLISSLILYAEDIVQELPNPDAVWLGTIEKTSWDWEIQLGRFLLPLYQFVLGYSIAPAVSTILSLGLLCLTTLLITKLFFLRDDFLRYLAGMFIIASPHVQSLLSYYYCSIAYSFSFLLAVLALMIFYKAKDKIWRNILLGALLLCLSAGGYQSYLSVTVTLCLMLLIFEVVNGDSAKAAGRQLLHFLAGGTVGVAMYLLANKLVIYILRTQNAGNRGFSTMGKIDWAGLPSRIYLYGHFYKEYFWGTELINNDYGIIPRRYLNLTFAIIAAIFVVRYLIVGKGKLRRRVIACFLTLFIPLATVSLFIFASQISILETTGSLMTPAFCLTYLFVLAFFEQTTGKPVKSVQKAVKVVSVLILLMLCHMALDGQSFVRYDMHQKVTIVRNLADELPEYMEECQTTKVIIVGYPEKGNYGDQYANLRDSVHWLAQSYGVIWPHLRGIQAGYERLCEDYAGFGYDWLEEAECKKTLANPIVENMPCYPEEGAIRKVGDIIVVKLSDYDL